MKLMKHITIALVLCAIPAMAFGQAGVADAAKVSVACPDDECHVAPYFAGSGGFVGEMADGFDEVNLVATCGNVSTSAKAEPDANGIVAMLFSMDNGLACTGNGSVEIHGLMDGGWYWITDDMNSAVSALLPKDAMDNTQAMPADPGSDDIKLTTVEGGSATFVKQMSTGRVGIIPHIVPEPPAAAPTMCGQHWNAGRSRIDQRGGGDAGNPSGAGDNCMLNASYHIVLTTGSGATAGGRVTSGAVTRNHTGELTVDVSLWGTGFVDTAIGGTAGTAAAIGDGFYYIHQGSQQGRALATDATDTAATTDALGFTIVLADSGVGGQEIANAGIAVAQAANADGDILNTVRLTIGDTSNDGTTVDGGYCHPSVGRAAVATVSIKANPGTNAVTPGIPDDWRAFGLGDQRPSATLRVMCPAASANQGQELVPDNPFPTTE